MCSWNKQAATSWSHSDWKASSLKTPKWDYCEKSKVFARGSRRDASGNNIYISFHLRNCRDRNKSGEQARKTLSSIDSVINWRICGLQVKNALSCLPSTAFVTILIQKRIRSLHRVVLIKAPLGCNENGIFCKWIWFCACNDASSQPRHRWIYVWQIIKWQHTEHPVRRLITWWTTFFIAFISAELHCVPINSSLNGITWIELEKIRFPWFLT